MSSNNVEFKVGDVVKRVSVLQGLHFQHMKVGDISTITKATSCGVMLKDYIGIHTTSCFELAQQPHPQADLIHAWANGETIVYWHNEAWHEFNEGRVDFHSGLYTLALKGQEPDMTPPKPKPVEFYANVYESGCIVAYPDSMTSTSSKEQADRAISISTTEPKPKTVLMREVIEDAS